MPQFLHMAGAGLGRILIVDDESAVREVLSEYFEEQGYAVETAGDGEAALTIVRQDRLDLVLLDVRMPGLDGVETLRRIRKVASSLAVIMVTANEDVDLARETLKLGALDYVARKAARGRLKPLAVFRPGACAHAGCRGPDSPALTRRRPPSRP
jgi:two-component system, response regulator, stage 0 sporulation protein F